MALTRLVPMLHVSDVRRSMDDVVGLHRDLAGRGVDVGPLCVTVYHMKEFSCLDPDGHMLTFGQETDEPPTPDDEERDQSR